MANNSAIEWTNDTWNPWQGCQKVSPGCKFCYMYRDKRRYGQDPMAVVRSSAATFNAPLKKLKGPLVFTCSWSDFFIEESDEWRPEAWRIIKNTPHLVYQILTKRPERVRECLPDDWGNFGYANVWLGVSVESQRQHYRLLQLVEQGPAVVRFISAEPLIGSLEIGQMINYFDWVITGGESGTKDTCRPCDLDWVRSIRDECIAHGIYFFHKQHGGYKKIGGAWGGRELDGQTWDEIPREYI